MPAPTASSSDAETPSRAAPTGAVPPSGAAAPPTAARLAALGARAFALAFGTYGACEALLGVVVPGVVSRLERGAFSLDPWVGTAFLVAYPLAGAGLGALVGALLGALGGRWLRAGWDARRLLLAAGSGCVVAAVIGNVAVRDDLGRSGAAFLVALAVLLAVGTASARPGPGAARRWPLLAHPFLVVPLVTALAWATRTWLPEARLLWRLAVSAGIFAGALLLAASVRGRAPGAGGRAVTAACALLAVGLFAVDHDPPPPPPLPPLTAAGSPAADPAHPPVVLIVLDTVRADHLSTYGYERPTDPNLARFASRAWVFERAVMPGDMTLSSHASLFTGQWVSHHGTQVGQATLPDEATTLAELLRGAGYTTLGISANCGWIGPGHGVDQGFQYWDTRCARPPFRGIGMAFLRSGLQEALRRAAFRERAGWAWRSAGSITDEALATLDRVTGRGAPFLLFLNYMDVHRPIHPPARYRRMFPGRMAGFDMQDDWSALHREVPAGRRRVTPAERDHLISQYDGALAYIDAQLGRVLARLDERGLLEPSLVIITSDHGESFGTHGTFGHGGSVYQAVVGVPLVVKLPGHREGRRVAGAVSGVDVLPTVAEVLGLALPPGVDGSSLLAPAPDPERPLLSESYEPEGLRARALLRGDEKLVERLGQPLQLYHLDADPREERDLAGEAPRRAAELAAAMRALEGAAARRAGDSGLTPEEAARLRALGYLEGP